MDDYGMRLKRYLLFESLHLVFFQNFIEVVGVVINNIAYTGIFKGTVDTERLQCAGRDL
jgi:hypothetical protein